MRKLLLAAVLVGLQAAPAAAQDMAPMAAPLSIGGDTAQKTWRERVVDAASQRLRAAASEVALARYRAALKLTAAQEKFWPAAAQALRTLARSQQVDEAAMRRASASMEPLIQSLDDNQKQTARSLAEQAGFAQYAAMF